MLAETRTIEHHRHDRSMALIGFLALLAFLAFLLFFGYPRDAGGNQQQVVVWNSGGCGCANATAPVVPVALGTDPHTAAAAPIRHVAPVVVPIEVGSPAAFIQVDDVAAILAAPSPHYATVAQPLWIGPGGSGATMPIDVDEPPAWILFVFGLLAVLTFAWSARRSRKAKDPA